MGFLTRLGFTVTVIGFVLNYIDDYIPLIFSLNLGGWLFSVIMLVGLLLLAIGIMGDRKRERYMQGRPF